MADDPYALPGRKLYDRRNAGRLQAQSDFCNFFRLPGHPGKLFCMFGRRDHHIHLLREPPGVLLHLLEQQGMQLDAVHMPELLFELRKHLGVAFDQRDLQLGLLRTEAAQLVRKELFHFMDADPHLVQLLQQRIDLLLCRLPAIGCPVVADETAAPGCFDQKSVPFQLVIRAFDRTFRHMQLFRQFPHGRKACAVRETSGTDPARKLLPDLVIDRRFPFRCAQINAVVFHCTAPDMPCGPSRRDRFQGRR